MDILSDKRIKARKQYRCDLCGVEIKVGELYCNQVVVVNGNIHNFKRHLKCDEICDRLNYYCEDGISSNDFKMLICEEYSFATEGKDNNVSFKEKLNLVYHRVI